MTRAEAEAECARLRAESPERHTHRWEIVPDGTEGYEKAEVTAGGIDTGRLRCLVCAGPLPKVSGPDGLKSFLSAMVSGIDEVVFVTHRQSVAGNTVMNERTDRFLQNGNWAELPVAGVFVVRDGKVAIWHDYFDLDTIMKQLAPPAE